MLRINGELVSEESQVSYGTMYMYESNDTITIAVASKYHMMSNADWVTGSVEGWSFQDGTTGAIASFADYSGTVADTISATDVGHGLVTGDDISIVGTTGGRLYDGVYTITRIDDDSFYFTNTNWVDTQTATWYEGAYLQASAGSAGLYILNWSVTFASAHASANRYTFKTYINSTAVDQAAAESTSAAAEFRSVSASAIVTITDGDRIYLAVQNITDTDNLECEHANISLHRL
jgi:hypothetical protein